MRIQIFEKTKIRFIIQDYNISTKIQCNTTALRQTYERLDYSSTALGLHCFLPLAVDFFVNGIRREESPHFNMFCLTISNETTHGLGFACSINLLGWGEQGRKENRMAGGGQISTAGALVHDVQQKHPFFAVVLEELEVLALLMRGTPDLQEGDLMVRKGLRNFLHEIRELHKDKDTIFL